MKLTEHTEVNAAAPTAIATLSAPVGTAAVDAMALRLATESPELADLEAGQLAAVARVVLGQRLAADLGRKVDLAGIDYEAEKTLFLAMSSRTKSEHTRRAYTAALERLETFAARLDLSPLELSPAQADDFAYGPSARNGKNRPLRNHKSLPIREFHKQQTGQNGVSIQDSRKSDNCICENMISVQSVPLACYFVRFVSRADHCRNMS